MYRRGKSPRLAGTHREVGFRGRKKPSQKHGIDGRFVAVFCTVCGDEGTVMCPRGNGSGEGMADGSRCLECFGTGSVPCPGEMHGEV